MITTEGWIDMAYDAASSVGVELNSVDSYNRWWIIFFFVLYFIGSLMVLNMFIGVLIEK